MPPSLSRGSTGVKRRWTAPLWFQQLVDDPDHPIPGTEDKLPLFTYFVFDLWAMTEAQILGLAACASLRLFLLIPRHIRAPDFPRDFAGGTRCLPGS
jgi:hypothetical protein